MYENKQEFCCICINTADNFVYLWEFDENTTKLSAKLTSCVPEIVSSNHQCFSVNY